MGWGRLLFFDLSNPRFYEDLLIISLQKFDRVNFLFSKITIKHRKALKNIGISTLLNDIMLFHLRLRGLIQPLHIIRLSPMGLIREEGIFCKVLALTWGLFEGGLIEGREVNRRLTV